MNPILITTAVSITIYLLFLTGLVLFEYDNIILLIGRSKLKHKLSQKDEERGITLWCKNLLSASLGKDIDGFWLMYAVGMIFILIFMVALRNFSVFASLMLAVFCSAMPVMVLFSKMQSLRNKGSLEGISLLTELYRQYKMNNLNILKAIELTITSKGDFNICKKQLYILLIRLQDAASASEIRKSCNNLAFALGTNWSRSLAKCIEIGAINGTDISLALSDIIEQLQTAKTIAEERKRLNGESMRMTLILVPLLYFLTIVVSLKYLNLSIVKLLRHQFLTPSGLFFFVVNLFLFVVNITIMNLIDSTRMDF